MMAEYTEFRLELSPNLEAAGTWNIQLVECPVKALIGPKGTATPVFTRQQLQRLRRREGWPNIGELRAIGRDVWNSVMTPNVEAAFEACIDTLTADQRMRVILVLLGRENELLSPNGVRLSELPVEALYKDARDFIAHDLRTPISRSLQTKADRPPVKIALPLRVLVVVAAPTDKPDADADKEAKAITHALSPFIDKGILKLEFCQPPTVDELKIRLAKPYHILHFIGHGGFYAVGDDETPQAHVCFVRSGSTLSDPVDADTLTILLRNRDIRLVILTACSSAAPTPDEEPYSTGAFEGIAQRILTGVSGVTATVAMQFDLESGAAVTFTRTFYDNLLLPNRCLDEVITMTRQELAVKHKPGHRAWVTPTVYWRCESGKVFDLEPIIGTDIGEDRLQELRDVEVQLEIYRRHLDDMIHLPPEIITGMADLQQQWLAEIAHLENQRGHLLGETVRLWGGRVKPAQEFACKLSFRSRGEGVIDLLNIKVQYPPDKVAFIEASAGQDSPQSKLLIAESEKGYLDIAILNPSQLQRWLSKEYEIGWLRFQISNVLEASILDLQVTILEVRRDGQQIPNVKALNGILFIDKNL